MNEVNKAAAIVSALLMGFQSCDLNLCLLLNALSGSTPLLVPPVLCVTGFGMVASVKPESISSYSGSTDPESNSRSGFDKSEELDPESTSTLVEVSRLRSWIKSTVISAERAAISWPRPVFPSNSATWWGFDGISDHHPVPHIRPFAPPIHCATAALAEVRSTGRIRFLVHGQSWTAEAIQRMLRLLYIFMSVLQLLSGPSQTGSYAMPSR